MKKLTCYQINDLAPPIVAARPERAWMDATRLRHAYRCLPLTIANSMGWEMQCPVALDAEWNGGAELDDLTIGGADPALVGHFAQSHFGNGVLTFQTSYLFRTEPGVALSIRGTPNLPKDGISPLDGIVETDWLPFTFTMNWIFTRPGRIEFQKGEPSCFITPIGYRGLDGLVPEVLPIEADPELAAAYGNYSALRTEFIERIVAGDAETLREGWQKWYMRGELPSGTVGNPSHLSKLRLAEPQRTAGPEVKKNSGQGAKRTRAKRKSQPRS